MLRKRRKAVQVLVLLFLLGYSTFLMVNGKHCKIIFFNKQYSEVLQERKAYRGSLYFNLLWPCGKISRFIISIIA
jgi:hypothetical protein